jgi:hypothetical protein
VAAASSLYEPTFKQDGSISIALQSITAMSECECKSFEELRLEYYEHKKNNVILAEGRSNFYYDSYEDEEKLLQNMSVDITEAVIEMLSEGCDKEEISEFVQQYLEDNYY